MEMIQTECPLCGADDARHVLTGRDRLHGLPGQFTLVRCRPCSHVYMNPRPAEGSLGDCYPADYGCHTPLEPEPDAPPPTSRAVRLMKWVPGLRPLYQWLSDKKSDPLPPGPAGVAVELGCGRGDYLRRLKQAGWTPVGVDLVPAAIESARLAGFDARLGTLSSAEIASASADAVCGWMVLEHVPDPREVVAEAVRVLRPEGVLMISVPDFAALDRRIFAEAWRGLELPRHLQHYTPRTVRRLLGDAGLADVSVVHQRSAFNVIASSGLVLRARGVTARLGQHLIDFTDSPSMFGELALAPLGKVLGWTRQSGRMTVTARKPAESAA